TRFSRDWSSDVCSSDLAHKANSPQWRRAPFAPVGIALGPVVGEALAHVVQQQVGVGPDQLEAMFGLWRVAPGDVVGHMAGRAARSEERRVGKGGGARGW